MSDYYYTSLIQLFYAKPLKNTWNRVITRKPQVGESKIELVGQNKEITALSNVQNIGSH